MVGGWLGDWRRVRPRGAVSVCCEWSVPRSWRIGEIEKALGILAVPGCDTELRSFSVFEELFT